MKNGILMLGMHAVIMTVLMGIGMITALSMGHSDAKTVLTYAAGGFLLAIPVTWFVTQQITKSRQK